MGHKIHIDDPHTAAFPSVFKGEPHFTNAFGSLHHVSKLRIGQQFFLQFSKIPIRKP